MRRLDPGSRVRIRRPGGLRDVTATVLRPAAGGYEIGFVSARGVPEHAVLHPRWLSVIGDDDQTMPGPERSSVRRHA